RGIYVSVMLFEGYVLQHVANSWSDHPFHEDNNISGIDGDPNGDGLGLETHTLDIQAITHLQEAYIRQVIDTVGDLDNVLYEISNESGAYSTEWQSHMIRFIKEYEARRTKQHPVGITVQWSKNPQHRGRNQSLYDSLADWISPGSNVPDGRQYQSDPPATDGRKVVFLDTDHLWGIGGDANWVWKSFTRGYSPLFMDPYDNSILGETSPADWDTIRMSLGQARRLADRVDLATMVPSEDFVSTKYCLADQDATYIVYLPPTGISRKSMAHSVKDWLLRMFGQLKGEVTVDLTATNGFFQVEWITPIEGTITPDEPVAGGAMRQFTAPFQGSAVLLLSKIQ
ncbi:MAG: hypothetical protein OEW13_13475, partial [Nitrospira sp.]|nr:hypothetical protein [Nitrospira sp.]